MRHNTRAVYQRYMGFYDANPSTLDQLPPADAAKKYVEYMGGEAAVLKKAKADFDKGEYRWVAEALKQVVFADPNNKDGKELLADTYEQMGYQAESGPWRSVYLQGAYELRNGVPSAGGINTASPDTIKAMPPEMMFDYFAVRLNGEKAAGKKIALNIDFTDLKKQYSLLIENGVLNYAPKPAANADAKITLTKATLDRIQLSEMTPEQAIDVGRPEGRGQARGVRGVRRHARHVPVRGKEFLDALNPPSERVVTGYLEPSLRDAAMGSRVQFERHGYFSTDAKDHAAGRPVFNKVSGLKDGWGK